jgi:hypothetical protein
MDALLIATTILALFGIVAGAAGYESREGFDGSDNGRSIGR